MGLFRFSDGTFLQGRPLVPLSLGLLFQFRCHFFPPNNLFHSRLRLREFFSRFIFPRKVPASFSFRTRRSTTFTRVPTLFSNFFFFLFTVDPIGVALLLPLIQLLSPPFFHAPFLCSPSYVIFSSQTISQVFSGAFPKTAPHNNQLFFPSLRLIPRQPGSLFTFSPFPPVVRFFCFA